MSDIICSIDQTNIESKIDQTVLEVTTNLAPAHSHGGLDAGTIDVPATGITTVQFDTYKTLVISGDGGPITITGKLYAPTNIGGIWLLIGGSTVNWVAIKRGVEYNTYFGRSTTYFRLGTYMVIAWVGGQSLWKEIYYQY